MSPLAHLEHLFLDWQHYFQGCGAFRRCGLAGSHQSLGASHSVAVILLSLLWSVPCGQASAKCFYYFPMPSLPCWVNHQEPKQAIPPSRDLCGVILVTVISKLHPLRQRVYEYTKTGLWVPLTTCGTNCLCLGAFEFYSPPPDSGELSQVVLASVESEGEGTGLMTVFYFDLCGSEWLLEELRPMNGNSPMMSSKCFMGIGFSSVPATHLRLAPLLWLLFFQGYAWCFLEPNSVVRKNHLYRISWEGVCLACMKPWVSLQLSTNRKWWPTLVILAVGARGNWSRSSGHHQLSREF